MAKKLTSAEVEKYRKGKSFDYARFVKDYEVKLIPYTQHVKDVERARRWLLAARVLR